MLNDKTVRGMNFTCFHAGPKEGWAQFRLGPPDVPLLLIFHLIALSRAGKATT